MFSRVFIFIAVIALTSAFAPQSRAGSEQITEQQITEEMLSSKNEAMEDVLNHRDDPMKLIRFFHEHISDDARFKLTVNNPVAENEANPVMEMSKQDYINTYLQGTQYVADYEMEIQNAAFQYDESKNQVFSVDIMTERGTMQSKVNEGKPFVSRTACRTKQELKDGKLVATAGECHTDISFEESI